MTASRKQAVDGLLRWMEHPDLFVREVFKVTPDPWQDDILQMFPHKPLIALQASKGPGKTCVLAWLCLNFLLTRPNPNIAATSVSGDNLRDGLWKECSRWMNESEIFKNNFIWSTTRIARKGPEGPNWFMSARTWPKSGDSNSQADTLSGLHSDFVMFVIDESGGVPPAVVVTAEAALSSCVEGHVVQAGNPSDLGSALAMASKDREEIGGRWKVVEITGDPDDPKRASRVSIEWARSQIRAYGRDNPWVMVNVLGKFPPGSINSLLSEDEVKAAMGRYYRAHDLHGSAKILGVDVAREGLDASVICRRQGLQTFPLHRYRGVANGVVGASITQRIWDEFDADACFVDATGGHGFTWMDQLAVLGKQPIGIAFNGKAHQDDRYYNRRAEMYFLAAEHIKNQGGALPGLETEGALELMQALVQTTYTHKGDRLLLEDKDSIKEKLGFSPDEGDAYVLTFADKVTPKARAPRANHNAMAGDYRAFADVEKAQNTGYGGDTEYRPFR